MKTRPQESANPARVSAVECRLAVGRHRRKRDVSGDGRPRERVCFVVARGDGPRSTPSSINVHGSTGGEIVPPGTLTVGKLRKTKKNNNTLHFVRQFKNKIYRITQCRRLYAEIFENCSGLNKI